jgi:hypothetical protein
MFDACAAPVDFRQRAQWQRANFGNGGAISYVIVPQRQLPRSARAESGFAVIVVTSEKERGRTATRPGLHVKRSSAER